MRSDLGRSAFTAALLSALLLGTACKNDPGTPAPKGDAAKEDAAKKDSAKVTDEATEKATVVSVDKATRTVTLKNKDGKTFPVACGPEVRNFDQIAAGNVVVVKYMRSLEVAMVKPGEAVTPPTAAVAAGRAEQGAKPGAAIAGQVTATVKIESVDQEKHVVVFTAPGGGLRVVAVQRPEGREFMKGLKPGDQVQITWTEAVAISVEKE